MTLIVLCDPDYNSYLEDVSAGSSGDEALRVKKRLSSLGYLDNVTESAFDDDAVEALKRFQRDAGLADDGVADADTSAALFSEDAPATERCVLHSIAFGDKGKVVRYVQRALLINGFTAEMPNGKYDEATQSALSRLRSAFPETVGDPAGLSAGEVAEIIDAAFVGDDADYTRVQRRLYSLCYIAKGGIDGRFGSKSQDALRAFQAANGLQETGEADEQTLAALFSGDAAPKPYPYRVEVSLDEQEVYMYVLNDSGSYDLARSCICSTGINNSTPSGVFLDGFPANRWHHFRNFICWAQYSYEIEGNIMFHSVLYGTNDERDLDESTVKALGTPASHGCVRLRVEDAQWLYEHCKRGTVAIVIY